MKETAKIFVDRRYVLLAPAQIVCEMALALVSSINCEIASSSMIWVRMLTLYSPLLQPKDTLSEQLRLPIYTGIYPLPFDLRA